MDLHSGAGRFRGSLTSPLAAALRFAVCRFVACYALMPRDPSNRDGNVWMLSEDHVNTLVEEVEYVM